MGATRQEILDLAAFWESRGDTAEAKRLRDGLEPTHRGDAWGQENGAWIHLESEMAVEQRDGMWVWIGVEDEDLELSRPFDTAERAMVAFEQAYAENPRHSADW